MHQPLLPSNPYPAPSYYGVGAVPTTAQLEVRSRTLYEQGMVAYGAGRYLDALEAFEAAYQAMSRPELLSSMGVTLYRIGRIDEARAKWRAYLRRDPQGPRAADVRGLLEATAPPETPVAPSVPPDVKEPSRPLATMLTVPSAAQVYETRGSTIGVWVATGVGMAVLVGLGVWLSRPKKPKANRRRNRRRR